MSGVPLGAGERDLGGESGAVGAVVWMEYIEGEQKRRTGDNNRDFGVWYGSVQYANKLELHTPSVDWSTELSLPCDRGIIRLNPS